jgi:ribonuclease HI
MDNLNKIIVYTDGGSRGNPGKSAIGVVINDKKYFKEIGIKTNNEAEYEAIIFALKKIKQIFGKNKTKKLNIEIRLDSELVYNQLTGNYKIKEPSLFPLFIEIWNLKMDFNSINFIKIPREQNKEADKLVNLALNKKLGG